jgi:hypothetical protein
VVDDTILCEDIPLGNPLDLAFAEHVHGFITLDGPAPPWKMLHTPTPDSRSVSQTDDPVLGVYSGYVK